MVQRQREALLRPVDFALDSSSDPYEPILPESFSQIVIRVPKADLSETLPIADMITAIAVDCRQTTGRQISRALTAIATETVAGSAESSLECLEMIVDLISGGQASLAEGTPCRMTRQNRLTTPRIESFIASNLNDPDLSHATIAVGMGVFVHRINELLAGKHSSITARVRDARLAQIANELLDPANSGQHISDLAGKWGFCNLQHFCRLFPGRYDKSARNFRYVKQLTVRPH